MAAYARPNNLAFPSELSKSVRIGLGLQSADRKWRLSLPLNTSTLVRMHLLICPILLCLSDLAINANRLGESCKLSAHFQQAISSELRWGLVRFSSAVVRMICMSRPNKQLICDFLFLLALKLHSFATISTHATEII